MSAIDNLRIAPWRLETEEVLGAGAFGIVYKGTWNRGNANKTTWEEDVAIKVLRDPVLIDKAEAEVLRMSRLDHPNIVKCFGISFPNNSPWIVMECMTGGDLLSYIYNYAGGMPVDVMTSLAYGIALGMQYLHHSAGQYHGDLAARNCLIGPNNTVKVGDFGKFDNDYEDSYFDWDHGQNMPCPLRWMPWENIPSWNRAMPRFNRKGDVWSYGVVLFEIWTRGCMPFSSLSNFEVKQALAAGRTPKDYKDVKAKWFILKLMDDCWNFNSCDRPNFNVIVDDLEEDAGHLLGIE